MISQEKRPLLAAEKKGLGEIAKELSAMWGADAQDIPGRPLGRWWTWKSLTPPGDEQFANWKKTLFF